MNWSIVKLIFCRELRDQLRDRRTLFTVAILPLLLYPLMGMAMLQVAQFMREYPTSVWIVGSENLPSDPAFLDDGKIHERWADPGKQQLQQLRMSAEEDKYFFDLIDKFKAHPGNKDGGILVDQLIQREMQRRDIDLAVIIPAPVSTEEVDDEPDGASAGLPQEGAGATSPDGTAEENSVAKREPQPAVYVFVNSASDKSKIAADRFNQSLARWQKAMIADKLAEHNISMTVIDPFRVTNADVAGASEKKAAAWSKILPFIIMIWSLTGAFYPAVDLCAGEKERGTFETLLSSPANRSDIAIGKLLTVMTFSILTSLLNLLSMGFTGLFVFSRISAMGVGGGLAASMGPPPLAAVGWLLLALIPISALFSAMALAAAAFARSSKEGQYYLIPLMMICMPLMMLPMLPAAKLDIGTSLIPVTGLMLMLRGLIEGQYAESLRFAGPVCAVTIACCWLAIRWVVTQFNSETVLFRASERFGVGAWLKHVLRERNALPSLGSAVICGMLILVLKFFIGFALGVQDSWAVFSKQTVIVLVATVAVPAILMALVLTRNPRKSLRLHRCSIPVACAAVLAAICLHPFIMWIMTLVMYMYPPAGDLVAMQEMVNVILADAPNIWVVLAVFALAPAVLEELAFRGFILSGAEAIKNKWGAVILTSLMFGLAHGIFQQSIITFFVGMILGWIAVRTGSLIPCVLYHATHNGLTVLLSFMSPSNIGRSPWLGWIFEQNAATGSFQYSTGAGIAMSVCGFGLLFWIVQTGGPRFLEQKKQLSEAPGFFDLGAVVDGLLKVKNAKQ